MRNRGLRGIEGKRFSLKCVGDSKMNDLTVAFAPVFSLFYGIMHISCTEFDKFEFGGGHRYDTNH